MSDTLRLPFTEQAHHLQAQELFETHRLRQYNHFYPEDNRVNLRTEPRVECHTEASTVTSNLHHLLKFGSTWDQREFDNFIENSLDDILKACSEQLLFWHISGETNSYNEPVDHILVWSNTDYFWFVLLPRSTREIHFFLEDGDHVYFLERFSLDHTKFELTFSEVRRISTPGEETYHWNSSLREITLDNPDHRINNPAYYNLPPQNPQDLDFVREQLRLREEEYRLILAQIDELDTTTSGWSTPPAPPRRWSTPPVPPRSPSLPIPTVNWFAQAECTCKLEVCTCGYRPITPRTPSPIVLWRPGDSFLPSTLSHQNTRDWWNN